MLADTANLKNNLTGYVTYTYAIDSYYDEWEYVPTLVTKTVKITVKIDTKDKKYKADAKTIVKGAANTVVTTTVKLDKKAVGLANVKAVTEGWTVSFGSAGAGADEIAQAKANGEVTLTAASPAAGKNTVEFRIITADSVNAAAAITDENSVAVKAVVTVLDPAAYTKKAALAKGANVVDLSDAKKTDKAFEKFDSAAAAATGKFMYTVDVSKVFTTVSGAQISMAAAAANAPEGFAAAVTPAKDGESAKLAITVNAAKVAQNKSYTFPVEIGFTDAAAVHETFKFTVKTPKTIATAATVKAAVENYLKAFAAIGDSAAVTDGGKTGKIATALADVIDPITGIIVTDVVCTYTPASAEGVTPAVTASYKAVVTLKDPQAEGDAAAIKVEAELLAPGTGANEPQDVDTALTAVEALADKIVGAKSGTDEEQKTQKLATEMNTVFALRAYLAPAITNKDLMLQISYYAYLAPTDGTQAVPAGESGYLEVEYKVISQTEASTEGTIDITIPAKPYEAPTSGGSTN